MRGSAIDRVSNGILEKERHFASSFICVAIFVAALCIIRPFANIATNDDWSYAQTARVFAQTGHLVYNGWATAMLGWQAVWGALFIKVFGFSFFVLRVSTILIGGASAFLLHRVLLRFGVGAINGTLGTLAVVLCPLFVPMAASFMTDVPCIFCLLLCVYGCQRALRARNDRAALLWLCGSAALNVLDGTVRQIVWLGALAIVPSAFWLLRRRRGFLLAGVVTWAASLIVVVLFMRWFQRQPYSLPEHILAGRLSAHAAIRAGIASITIVLDVLLFALPVLIAWLPSLTALRKAGRTAVTIFFAGLGPLLLWLDRFGHLRHRLPPWIPNIVSRYGIFWSVPSVGPKPEVIDTGFRVLVLAVLIAVVCAFIVSRFQVERLPVVARTGGKESLTFRETSVLLAPFCLSYVTALLPRAAFSTANAGIYDRYCIPLVLMVVILLLRLYEAEYEGPLPASCWVALSIFSLFSIAGTHDAFADYRAVDAAIQEMRAANIPPTSISGGWVYDGWTQIEAEGHINEPRIVRPAGAYREVAHPALENCAYWFGPFIPAVHPEYVVVAEPLGCLQPSRFPDVNYTTWLPPYGRRILVERNEAAARNVPVE